MHFVMIAENGEISFDIRGDMRRRGEQDSILHPL